MPHNTDAQKCFARFSILALVWLTPFPVSAVQDASAPQDPASSPVPDTFDLFHRVPHRFGIEVQLGSVAGGRRVPTLFTGIPQKLRTVPTNPDDHYPAGTEWTIPGDSFTVADPDLSENVFVSIAPQFTLWRVTVRGGLRIVPGTTVTSTRAQPGDAIPEINQQGTADRGYGESLVYYFLYWDSKQSGETKPFGELEFRVTRFVSVIGGYGRTGSVANVNLENGWDRYDAFEPNATQRIVSRVQSSGPFYGALRIAIFGPYAGMRIGYSTQRTFLTDVYPGVNANFAGDTRAIAGIFWALDVRLTQSKLTSRK